MSKKLIIAFTLAALLLAATSPSFAYRRGRGGYGCGGYGGFGYGGMGAGSTAAGSFLAGAAMYTQGAGQYNLYTSMAAKNYQDAYGQWMDNQKKREQTYFDMRRMNASYRAEMEAQRSHPTSDQIVAFNKSRDPERLSAEKYDAAKGVLNWPPVLKEPEFAAQRDKLESLFAERMSDPGNAGLGTHNYRDTQRVVNDMHDALHAKLDQISADEYIAASKFLRSVGYESRFVPESNLASAQK